MAILVGLKRGKGVTGRAEVDVVGLDCLVGEKKVIFFIEAGRIRLVGLIKTDFELGPLLVGELDWPGMPDLVIVTGWRRKVALLG